MKKILKLYLLLLLLIIVLGLIILGNKENISTNITLYSYDEVLENKQINADFLSKKQSAFVEQPSPYYIVKDNNQIEISFWGLPDYYYYIYIRDEKQNVLFKEEIGKFNNYFYYNNAITIPKVASGLQGYLYIYASSEPTSIYDYEAWRFEYRTWQIDIPIAFKRNSSNSWIEIISPSSYSALNKDTHLIEINGKVLDGSNLLHYSFNDGLSTIKEGDLRVNNEGKFKDVISLDDAKVANSKLYLLLKNKDNFIVIELLVEK